jgi:hypothetical protein
MKSMKKFFLFSIVTISSSCVFAQSLNNFNYKIDGKENYLVTGAVPGTQLTFRSDTTGVGFLYEKLADGSGRLVYEQAERKAAFVLNNKNTSSEGSGKVAFAVNIMELNHLKLQERSEMANLSWEALVKNEHMVFDVLESRNNAPFEIVKSIPAYSVNHLDNYEFTAKREKNVQYKLQVRDETSGFSYLSSPMSLGLKNECKVYPTKVTDFVFIESPADFEGSYSITDAIGKHIQSGKLKGGKNEIPLKQLSDGIYNVSVESKNDLNSTARIVK